MSESGSEVLGCTDPRGTRPKVTQVGFPRERTRQTAARPNDVLDEEPFGPPTDYIECNGMAQAYLICN